MKGHALKLSSICIDCTLHSCMKKVAKFTDEDKKSLYMRECLQRVLDLSEYTDSPCIGYDLKPVYEKYFGEEVNEHSKVKPQFNELMLNMQDKIQATIDNSEDPFLTAARYAMAANYIDFSTVKDVTVEGLLKMLDDALHVEYDTSELFNFKKELESAKNLVFIHDNCGEIVLDKLFIRQIRKDFPHLSVTCLVRGGEVINDVTLEDATQVGLNEVAEVMHSGIAIAGTPVDRVSEECLKLLENADIILAKGQGNYETMNGCELNIYYMFLCKCEWFQHLFDVPRFTAMIVNERRLKTRFS